MGRLKLVCGCVFILAIYACMIIVPIVFSQKETPTSDTDHEYFPDDKINPSLLSLHDCMPDYRDDDELDKTECLSRGCVFSSSADPSCSFTSTFYHLKHIDRDWSDRLSKRLTTNETNGLISTVIKEVTVEQSYSSDTTARVLITPTTRSEQSRC